MQLFCFLVFPKSLNHQETRSNVKCRVQFFAIVLKKPKWNIHVHHKDRAARKIKCSWRPQTALLSFCKAKFLSFLDKDSLVNLKWAATPQRLLCICRWSSVTQDDFTIFFFRGRKASRWEILVLQSRAGAKSISNLSRGKENVLPTGLLLSPVNQFVEKKAAW